MRTPLRQSSLLLAALFLSGCSDPDPDSGLPIVMVDIGSKAYKLEVAADSASQEKGLMQRDSVGLSRGMIFAFREDRELAFWMKNTRIPLDIIYLDNAGRVVSIATMKAYATETTPSYGACRFAIELNAGQAATTGLKKGDFVKIPADVRTKAGL